MRYFVVRHVHNRLNEIERRSSALAAFADDRAEYARELEMVQDFRRSLPQAMSRRLVIVLAILSIVVLLRGLSELALDRANPSERKELELLVRLENSLLSLNLDGGFLDALATTPMPVTADLFLGVAISAYIVLRLAYPGFRLKRVLFNVYPRGKDGLRRAAMREHVTAVDGVYALESAVLASLGVAAKREFPFDLAVSTLGALLFTGIGVGLVVDGDTSAWWLAVVGLVRLAWLGRAYFRRRRAQPLPHEAVVESEAPSPRSDVVASPDAIRA